MPSYWEKRALQNLAEAEKNSIVYLKKVKKVYKDASKSVLNDIKSLYNAFWTKNGLDTNELQKLAKISDLKRLKKEVEKLGLELPKNYQGRLTRLELLDAQLWERTKEIEVKERELTTASYAQTFSDTYYKSIYDISKGVGANLSFSKLNDKAINKILNTRFYGENYSKRIWDNSEKFAEKLQEVVAKAVINGDSIYKTSKAVMYEFGTNGKPKQAFYNAERLVRTETNYFYNAAKIEAFDDLGVEKYEFIATLDDRTSEICQEHDGKIFDIKTAKEGEDIPPLHPFCRSTISPVVEGFEPAKRIARNPKTGKNEIIENMTYKEWYEKYVE